ncbi:amino acid permease [Anopheles sinensis]|uniref:Amino acid permease n=1 Tax=Anopheles sinensis TaxID=74873 RepID=A0A084WTD5_ANOSI|nr:amino acid permease [Anopheles sinensis]
MANFVEKRRCWWSTRKWGLFPPFPVNLFLISKSDTVFCTHFPDTRIGFRFPGSPTTPPWGIRLLTPGTEKLTLTTIDKHRRRTRLRDHFFDGKNRRVGTASGTTDDDNVYEETEEEVSK